MYQKSSTLARVNIRLRTHTGEKKRKRSITVQFHALMAEKIFLEMLFLVLVPIISQRYRYILTNLSVDKCLLEGARIE